MKGLFIVIAAVMMTGCMEEQTAPAQSSYDQPQQAFDSDRAEPSAPTGVVLEPSPVYVAPQPQAPAETQMAAPEPVMEPTREVEQPQPVAAAAYQEPVVQQAVEPVASVFPPDARQLYAADQALNKIRVRNGYNRTTDNFRTLNAIQSNCVAEEMALCLASTRQAYDSYGATALVGAIHSPRIADCPRSASNASYSLESCRYRLFETQIGQPLENTLFWGPVMSSISDAERQLWEDNMAEYQSVNEAFKRATQCADRNAPPSYPAVSMWPVSGSQTLVAMPPVSRSVDAIYQMTKTGDAICNAQYLSDLRG